MLPQSLLLKLRQLLTQIETENNIKSNAEDKHDQNQDPNKDSAEQTNSTDRQIRLHARLRRLLDRINHQDGDDVPCHPAHPWMMRMEGRPTCWQMPWRRRRLLRRMRGAKDQQSKASAEEPREQESNQAVTGLDDDKDVTMAATCQDALEDFQDLQKDDEKLSTE